MADYNIRLGVEVDTSNIQSQINGIKPDPINVQLDTRNLQNQINNIRQQLLDLNNIRINLGGAVNGGAGGNAGGRGARRQIDDTARAYRELISLQNRIGSKQQKVAKLDTSNNQREILELSNQIENLIARYQQIHSLFNGQFSPAQLDGLNRGFQVAGENLDAIREKAADVRTALARGINQNLADGAFDKQIINAETAMSKLSRVSDSVRNSMDEVRASLREMQVASSSGDNNALITSCERYERALESLNNQLSINIKTEQQLNNAEYLQLSKESALLKLESLFENGSDAAKRFGSEVQRLRSEINQCNTDAGMKNLNKQVSNLDTQIKSSGLQTKTIGTRLKEQFDRYKGYLSIASVFMYATQGLKDMFQQVVAVDTAMTELKKVTNETDASYDKFLSNAAQRSKEIGTTIDGLVGSTADFARLGYSFEQSAGLAEVANIYAVVGDEIDGVEGATQSLVSTMAAFKDEMNDMSDSDFAMSIVDKFNEVSNNFAISSGGIGEAMERSASSLKAANNTIDESIAMITAANEVTQNPEKVGKWLCRLKKWLYRLNS